MNIGSVLGLMVFFWLLGYGWGLIFRATKQWIERITQG